MKTILVAVTGISPAILTETVWALAEGTPETPPAVPDEVVAITTTRGRADIQTLLLTPLQGWGGRTVWETLRCDVIAKVPGASKQALQLAVRVIDLPDGETGVRREADDLRTREHNDEAANFILQTLLPYTEVAGTRIVASIAGGRKTMGALLYAAMSLVGREIDRVTHVLVGEPFETCRGFFYPKQPVEELAARPPASAGGIGTPAAAPPLLASEARVEMADIPFVPLRNGFAELNEARRGFGDLVSRYTRDLKRLPARRPRISLDLEKGRLTVEGRTWQVRGRNFLVMAFFMDRLRRGQPHFSRLEQAVPEIKRFWTSFDKENPFSGPAKSYKDADATPDDSDLVKVLSEFRKQLGKWGLDPLIPYLCPRNSRLGFDAEIVSDLSEGAGME